MPSSTIATEPLKTILRMELHSDCDNTIVIGGLDKFMLNWSRENRPNIKSADMVQAFNRFNLKDSGYASLDRITRKQWVEGMLEWLESLEDISRDVTQASKRHSVRKRNIVETCLDSPVTAISGIKMSLASKLQSLDIMTIRNLLYYFPRRYIDFSNAKSLAEVKAGIALNEEQTVYADIWESGIVNLGRRKGTEIIIGDKTGTARAVWFNQPFLCRTFRTNQHILLTGKVTIYRGQLVFESPEWEIVSEMGVSPANLQIPVYSLTSGIYPRQMRNLIKRVLDQWAGKIEEFLPASIRERNKLPGIAEAVYQMHYPQSVERLADARRRLAFDELFLIQMGVLKKRNDWQADQPGHALDSGTDVIKSFLDSLPFLLTDDQRKALKDILADIKQPKAMSRLLQGDVGSGKTVIAVVSLLAAAASGYQGALMAPTEILAEQHYLNICKLLTGLSRDKNEDGNVCQFRGFAGLDISFALLTGRLTEKEKAKVQKQIEQGKADIVVGTHALIQKGVEFKKLGMAVVDEQHRFGVTQRSALRQKGFNPHILVMTATPIPRTLALTVYGDLDISVIRELPPGRQPIKTRWFKHEMRGRAYEFIRNQIREGHQAFIICPLIEESDNIEARAAVTEFKRLSEEIFPEYALGLLHGKMSSEEKDVIMKSFRDGSMNILVSTPVVEVGIDVPNATVILIEGAERFGLAQLHQFRGRVGRGQAQSYCLLLSETSSAEGAERLKWMEEISDGFQLAEKDLLIRGPGEFFGTRQSGLPDLRVAKLSDVQLLTIARDEAAAIFRGDLVLNEQEKQLLYQELARVWPTSAEWS